MKAFFEEHKPWILIVLTLLVVSGGGNVFLWMKWTSTEQDLGYKTVQAILETSDSMEKVYDFGEKEFESETITSKSLSETLKGIMDTHDVLLLKLKKENHDIPYIIETEKILSLRKKGYSQLRMTLDLEGTLSKKEFYDDLEKAKKMQTTILSSK